MQSGIEGPAGAVEDRRAVRSGRLASGGPGGRRSRGGARGRPTPVLSHGVGVVTHDLEFPGAAAWFGRPVVGLGTANNWTGRRYVWCPDVNGTWDAAGGVEGRLRGRVIDEGEVGTQFGPFAGNSNICHLLFAIRQQKDRALNTAASSSHFASPPWRPGKNPFWFSCAQTPPLSPARALNEPCVWKSAQAGDECGSAVFRGAAFRGPGVALLLLHQRSLLVGAAASLMRGRDAQVFSSGFGRAPGAACSAPTLLHLSWPRSRIR